MGHCTGLNRESGQLPVFGVTASKRTVAGAV